MRVLDVALNLRRQSFEIEIAGRGKLAFPFAKADPPASREDPVVEAFVDAELGRDGVTYRLASGAEGSVLADHVLEYHRDPAHMRDLLLHQLTVEARRRIENAPIGIREISRRLRTSPAQVYRLLDTTNYRKTVDRMLELLQVLDARVELKFV